MENGNLWKQIMDQRNFMWKGEKRMKTRNKVIQVNKVQIFQSNRWRLKKVSTIIKNWGH